MLASISYEPIPIFEIGPLNLSLHGLFAGIGFAVGAFVMMREVRARRFDADQYWSVLGWALVGAIIGARLFTIPGHLADPGYDLATALSPAGSYSIMAGFAGGILAGWWRVRRLGLDIFVSLDMAAPGMAVGTVVGRIGDLAIVEHLGGPTDFFLGFAIKPGYDVAPQHDVLECTVSEAVNGICGVYHHSALYDMLGALVLLGVLILLRSKWTTRHYGHLFALWMGWYGLQRFFVDFARHGIPNADRTGGALTWSQWAGLVATAAAVYLYFWLERRYPVVSSANDVTYGASPEEQLEAET